MNGTGRAGDTTGRRGSYFFLSYAHSPPLAGSLQAEPDQSVRMLFYDLTDAVARLASPESGLAPGFFDQVIPLGGDWKASVTRALSTAEVFVPLYSPGYFARSLPGRELACFYERMLRIGIDDPEQRFAAVRWIPFPRDQDRGRLSRTLDVGAAEGAYAENGLRALMRLAPYRTSYQQVVEQIAARIVELAERAPIGPSTMADIPDIDETESEFNPEASAAVFAVTVVAPSRPSLPDGPDPASYGDNSTAWRPFSGEQDQQLAEHAARVAERLDFAVLLMGIEKVEDINGRAGVILIDPWFVADRQRLDSLRQLVRGLRPWVLPLLVVDPPADTRVTQLADQVRAILVDAGLARTDTARRAINGVTSLSDFVTLMPVLVAEAERQYLRDGPIERSMARPGFRLRLTSDGGTAHPAPRSASTEEHNA